MAIDLVKIRARITIGSLRVETPYILSFNVSKARGQIGTFSARIKVSHSDVSGNLVGNSIEIEAGENTPSTTIFQGIVKKATISPVFDDPQYVSINLSGEDILSLLKGKKYTRRCKSTLSTWYSITGVIRKGLRSSKFRARKADNIVTANTELSEDSTRTSTMNLGMEKLEKSNEKLKGQQKPTVATEVVIGSEEPTVP